MNPLAPHLFLDMDGVLSSWDWWCVRLESPPPFHPSHKGYEIDPRAVKELETILLRSNCKVVISSTWRKLMTYKEIAALLVQVGLDPELEDRFVGQTVSYPHVDRGLQIQWWLDQNPSVKVDQIAILDDDSDMAHLASRHVRCDIAHGLTPYRRVRAIELLVGEEAREQLDPSSQRTSQAVSSEGGCDEC